jgi:hypothetical protein
VISGTCNPLSRTTSNPQAGVWEVTVDARRNSDAVSAPYTLAASILGATVSPNPDVIPSATVGVPVARSYTITNLLGAFTGRAVGTALGSAFRDTPTIAHLAQQTFDVMVATGSTSLRATIGSPSDPAADLDLFVYNCTTGSCVLAGQNADGDSEESVTIANPAAGLWRVLVDGFSVPAGSTTYNYVDVFSNPAFGAVSVTDADALRPAGSVDGAGFGHGECRAGSRPHSRRGAGPHGCNVLTWVMRSLRTSRRIRHRARSHIACRLRPSPPRRKRERQRGLLRRIGPFWTPTRRSFDFRACWVQ